MFDKRYNFVDWQTNKVGELGTGRIKSYTWSIYKSYDVSKTCCFPSFRLYLLPQHRTKFFIFHTWRWKKNPYPKRCDSS